MLRMKIFAVSVKVMPITENIRGLHLAAVNFTTAKVSKISLYLVQAI